MIFFGVQKIWTLAWPSWSLSCSGPASPDGFSVKGPKAMVVLISSNNPGNFPAHCLSFSTRELSDSCE